MEDGVSLNHIDGTREEFQLPKDRMQLSRIENKLEEIQKEINKEKQRKRKTPKIDAKKKEVNKQQTEAAMKEYNQKITEKINCRKQINDKVEKYIREETEIPDLQDLNKNFENGMTIFCLTFSQAVIYSSSQKKQLLTQKLIDLHLSIPPTDIRENQFEGGTSNKNMIITMMMMMIELKNKQFSANSAIEKFILIKF